MDITPGAVSLLQRIVGNDLTQMSVELEKLAAFATGATLDEEAVTAVVGVRHGETPYDLFILVARREGARAVEILPRVMEQSRLSGVQIVMSLTVHILALAFARSRLDRGTARGAVSGEMFQFLKGGAGAFVGAPWGEAVKAWMPVVDRWSAPELEEALRLLLAADRALKESRVSSEDQVIVSLILSLNGATPTSRRAA
jgi:DNA polymerase-3 subunit delta